MEVNILNMELKQVSYEEKEILSNLLEKYNYEFSQWNKRDVNQLGLYGYQYLDHYWTDDCRWVYFIVVENKLAGFAMVHTMSEVEGRETDFQLAEFFVLHKYRRSGIGKQAFFKVLDLHRGKWQLKRHPANIASVHFWNHAISEYTNGQYELIESHPQIKYNDGTLADIFFFEN